MSLSDLTHPLKQANVAFNVQSSRAAEHTQRKFMPIPVTRSSMLTEKQEVAQ